MQVYILEFKTTHIHTHPLHQAKAIKSKYNNNNIDTVWLGIEAHQHGNVRIWRVVTPAVDNEKLRRDLECRKVNEEAYQIYKVLRKCPVEFYFERGVGSGIIKSTRVGV